VAQADKNGVAGIAGSDALCGGEKLNLSKFIAAIQFLLISPV
jgi:hypothetical protein